MGMYSIVDSITNPFDCWFDYQYIFFITEIIQSKKKCFNYSRIIWFNEERLMLLIFSKRFVLWFE